MNEVGALTPLERRVYERLRERYGGGSLGDSPVLAEMARKIAATYVAPEPPKVTMKEAVYSLMGLKETIAAWFLLRWLRRDGMVGQFLKNLVGGKVTTAIGVAVLVVIAFVQYACGQHLWPEATCVQLLSYAAAASAAVHLVSPKLTVKVDVEGDDDNPKPAA